MKDKDKQFIDKFDNKTKKHDKNSDYETSLKDKDQQVINSYSDKGKKAPRDSNEEYETSLRDKEDIIKSIIEKHNRYVDKVKIYVRSDESASDKASVMTVLGEFMRYRNP